MEPIPRRSIGGQGGEEPESLFLLVLSCPVDGGWELLKERVSTRDIAQCTDLTGDPRSLTSRLKIGTRARDSFRQCICKLYGKDGLFSPSPEATWLAKEREAIELSIHKLTSGLLRSHAPWMVSNLHSQQSQFGYIVKVAYLSPFISPYGIHSRMCSYISHFLCISSVVLPYKHQRTRLCTENDGAKWITENGHAHHIESRSNLSI